MEWYIVITTLFAIILLGFIAIYTVAKTCKTLVLGGTIVVFAWSFAAILLLLADKYASKLF